MISLRAAKRFAHQSVPAFFLMAMALMSLLSTGCNTLSSLGLPVSSGPNKVLNSAKEISESIPHAAPIARELNETVLTTYLVEPGDILYVEPAKFDSPVRLPGDQPVQPDGSISLGRFGRLNVVRKTIPQIQAEVQSIIETVEPKSGPINVRLINWDSKSFYVLGEVNSPGTFAFDGNETVLDAILEAGGLTLKANHHRVLLSRPTHPNGCRVVLPICYDQIVQLGDASTNYQIMPGDRVFVSSISFVDDLKASLFPFLDSRCPKCSCPPVGCDPCNLPVPEYAQPHFYERLVPVGSVPISDTLSGTDSGTDSDVSKLRRGDEGNGDKTGGDMDIGDKGIDKDLELDVDDEAIDEALDKEPLKPEPLRNETPNPSFESFDNDDSTSRRAISNGAR